MDAFGFLGKVVRPLRGRGRVLAIDQSTASNFAIHPHLFDKSEGWIYKGDLVPEGIEKVLAEATRAYGRKRRKRSASLG